MSVLNQICVVLLQHHGKSREVFWGIDAYKNKLLLLEACNFLITCYMSKPGAYTFISAYLGNPFIEELSIMSF